MGSLNMKSSRVSATDCTCAATRLWDRRPIGRQLDVVDLGRQLQKCNEGSSIFAWSLPIKIATDCDFTRRTRSHLLGCMTAIMP